MRISAAIVFLCVACLVGCATRKNSFVEKTDAELDDLERQAESIAVAYNSGRYEEACRNYKKMAEEMTVSCACYQLDSIPPLIFSGKDDVAHNVMMQLRENLESVYSVDSEKKALSKWHGEVNKLFKGEAHERATLYALLALSYGKRGAIEDAWRCVQNGLLHDGDSQKRYKSDYALLWYLGLVYARKLGEEDAAEQCRNGLMNSLRERGVEPSRLEGGASPASRLFDCRDPNGMIVVWTGGSPRFGRGGKFGERRVILRGAESAFDFVSVVDEVGKEYIVPQRIGDINFQASTHGGRLMDGVLKLKSDFKEDVKAYEKAASIAVESFSQAGLPGDPFAKVTGFALSSVSKVFEKGFSSAADAVDARADVRSWRTLPGNLDILPVRLSPGRHMLTVRGYVSQEIVIEKKVCLEIPSDDGVGVVHVKMNDIKMNAVADAVRKMKSGVKLAGDKGRYEGKDCSSRMVGVWHCWMDVEMTSSQISDDNLLRRLPVATEVALMLEADGTARVTELEERMFGNSSGTWKCRNGMLELDLKNEMGRAYKMTGVVGWKGNDIFELRYMANDWRDMMKIRLSDSSDSVMAGCVYSGDKMKITIVIGGKSPKMAEYICSTNVFRRQWGL